MEMYCSCHKGGISIVKISKVRR